MEEEVVKEFKWGKEQQKAMDLLKNALVSLPALRPIVYEGENTGKIILGVDASLAGFGAIL